MNEQNELHSRNLHINGLLKPEKVDIGSEKVDIESLLSTKMINFTAETKTHIHKLFKQFGLDAIFGRSAIVKLLSLQNSSASKLISKLLQAEIIERVAGYGKGK